MNSYDDIDPEIRPLVRLLNSISGVTTFSSCAGHADPGPCQRPLGEGYVIFDIERTQTGWEALALLIDALNFDHDMYWLNVCAPTSAGITWTIDGMSHDDIGMVVEFINDTIANDGGRELLIETDNRRSALQERI